MLDDRLALQLRGQLTRGQKLRGFSEVLLRNREYTGMGPGSIPVLTGKSIVAVNQQEFRPLH